MQRLQEHYRDLLQVQLWLLAAWVVKLDRRQLLVLCSLKALMQVRRRSGDNQVDQYNQALVAEVYKLVYQTLVEAESSLGVKHQAVKHQEFKQQEVK
jgi:hypothetical protein